MNALLDPSSDDTASTVRERVSAWIEEHVPPDWLAAARSSDPRKLREVRSREDYEAWYPTLAAAGLVAPGWARPFGGLGLPAPLVRVVNEVLAAARLSGRPVGPEGSVAKLFEAERNFGERVLGLPAEPAVDRDIAWQDILSRRA